MLPTVKPFYSVKCNPDQPILRLLSWLGCSFDCASQSEIDIVMNQLGEHSVGPKRVVFAHPQKHESHIQFADRQKVGLTVVDSEEELHKMALMRSKMAVLLRLAV
jgi:ornithine decarboxylase